MPKQKETKTLVDETKETKPNQPKTTTRRNYDDQPDTVLDVLKNEFKNSGGEEKNAGFFKTDIFDVPEEEQNRYFNVLKDLFAKINIQKPNLDLSEYVAAYAQVLEMVTEMAVCGCVPAMDYLCFIYKKGVDDVMPLNLVRAHQWGLLATACGSRLSPERLRLFLDPVYKYITTNDLVPGILEKFDAQDEDDLINYIAYSFANIFNEKQGLTLEYMSKLGMITNDSFQVFLKNAARIREDSLPLLKKYIA